MTKNESNKFNKKNEAMLEAYIDSVPHMIWFQDRGFRYVKTNKAFKQRIKKKNPNQILGKKVEEFWSSELAKLYAKENKEILKSKKIIKKEEILKQKNGKKIYLETIKGPVLDKKSEIIGFFGSSFDVTPYKKTETSLKESNKKFKCLVESLEDIVYSLDKKNKIKYISPVAEKILGYKVNEMIGRKFSNFVHKEDLRKFENFLEEISRNKSGKIEHRMLKKNKKIVWVKNFNRLKCKEEGLFEASGLISDLTEQKEIESKLVESYEYLGDINRRISVFLNFDQMLKTKASREGVIDIVLQSLLEISGADSIYIGKFDKKKEFLCLTNKLLKGNYHKKTFCNNNPTKLSERNIDFLNDLEKNNIIIKNNQKEVELSKMKINEKVKCYFTISIYHKRKVYGFLLFCFKKKKIMQEHEKKLYLMLGSFMSFVFSELKYYK